MTIQMPGAMKHNYRKLMCNPARLHKILNTSAMKQGDTL